MRLLAAVSMLVASLAAQSQSLQQLASPNRTLVVKFEHGTAQVGSRWLVDAGPLNGRGNYSESTWSTDGTEAGTRIVGPAAASKYVSQGGFAYYIATNGKLIRTDGSGAPQGTQTLDAPVAGPDLISIAGVLYIVGPNGIQKTDGTAAGTVQLTPAGLAISQVVPLGAKLLFVGNRAAEGSELWVSDGTVAGTTIVKDILPGTASSNPQGLGVGGGKAFFWAVDDPLSTRKLWSTDGTAAGTVKLSDSLSPASFSAFLDFNGYAYFSVSGNSTTSLMRSDGTPAGTVVAMNNFGLASNVVVLGDAFYQWGSGGVVRSDGTGPGTTTIAYAGGGDLFAFNGKLHFLGPGVGFSAQSIVRMDGSGAGPYTFVDTGVATQGSWHLALGAFLLTQLSIDSNGSYANESALLGDGTAANTHGFRFSPGAAYSTSYCGGTYATLGNVVLFAANDGEHGCELWRTDGTAAGTFLLKDTLAGIGMGLPQVAQYEPGTSMVVFNGLAYFTTDGWPYTGGLWRTDGTAEGTFSLGPWGTAPVAIGSKLYFTSNDCGSSPSHYSCPELYTTDGTVAGTVGVRGFYTDPFGGTVGQLVSIGSKGYLVSNDPSGQGLAIFATDGTAGGTQELTPFAGANSIQLFAARGQAFAWVIGTNATLYRIDGATNALRMITTLPAANLGTASVGVFGDTFFYAAVDPADNRSAVFSTNGNAPVKIAYGTSSRGVATPDGLYFNAGDYLYSSTGGSPALFGPMQGFSTPTAVGRTVFFFGSDGLAYGLWRVDPFRKKILGGGFSPQGPVGVLPTGLVFFSAFDTSDVAPAFYNVVADAMTFTEARNVGFGVTVTSSPQLVDGLLAPTTATATGGQMCVSSSNGCSCDVAAFGTSATVDNGQYVCLRHTSATTPMTGTITTLSLGLQLSMFASYTPAVQHLSVSKAGTGSGRIASFVPGIDCGTTCAMDVVQGSTVNLAAVQALGSSFRGWSGACTSGDVTCSIVMNADASVTATFGASVRRGLAGDLDGDGIADILWRNGTTSASWLMSPGGWHDANVLASPVAGAVVVNRGDFDGDGKTDLLWRTSAGEYWITLQAGLSTTASKMLLPAGTGWEVVAKGDFNGDGKTDLVWRGPTGEHRLAIMNGASDPGYFPLADASLQLSVAFVADFNGDGKSDIVWTGADGSTTMYLMDGTAILEQKLLLAGGTGWSVVNYGDFDGDGKADLVWRNTNGQYGIWFMDGTSAWTYASLIGAGTGWNLRFVRDLDGDGKSDVIWSHPDGRWAAWLMKGGNAVAYTYLQGAGSGAELIASEDYDADGRDDLLWLDSRGGYSIWYMAGLTPKGFLVLLNGGTGWSPLP